MFNLTLNVFKNKYVVSCVCIVGVLFYVAQLSPIDTSLLQKRNNFLLFHLRERNKKTCEKTHSLDKQLTN